MREGPSNRSTTHPRACAPVACALFGGHDYENDHGVSLSVYSLLPRRRAILFFFARLPIIVHEQRPPSFSTPLLVPRAFLVARSRERGRGREGEAASTRRYNSLFCAKVLGPLSLMGGSRGLFWRGFSLGRGEWWWWLFVNSR